MSTTRFLTACVLVASCSWACSEGASPSSVTAGDAGIEASDRFVNIEAERAAVRATFLGYRRAIAAQRGDEAVEFASEKTLDFYEYVRVAALKMQQIALRKKPLFERFLILSVRARFTRSELAGGSGRFVFVTGVNRGWIGDNVDRMEPDEIRVDGDTARMGFRTGDSVVPSVYGFRLFRENSVWKLDLMSITKIVEPALHSMLSKFAADGRMTEEDAMVEIVSQLAERKIGSEIWEPLVAETQ